MKDNEYKEGLLKGKRVLIIEDNGVNASLMEESLNAMGILTDVALDGAVGLEQIENTPSGYYDCIMMDIQMPGMDGYEATKRIRQMKDERKAGVPIIAVTSYTFEEDIRKAYEAGMNGFQAKPIMPKLIYQELCRQILH
jgi:CheY-like chemotaxis protein